MKKLIIFLIFWACVSVSHAQTYYIQDSITNENASDTNNGTSPDTPWATLQHGFDYLTGGSGHDTIYWMTPSIHFIAAGTSLTLDSDGANGSGHGDHGHDSITVLAYGTDTVFIDGSNTTSREELFEVWNTNYFEINGLQGNIVFQNKSYYNSVDNIVRQVIFYNNGNLHIEKVTSRNSYGYGFTINAWDTLYLINCDSYEHANLEASDPGNKPDGFAISSGGEATDYGYVQGCRAWRCSDDGMEYSPSTAFIIDSLWVFCNGYGSGGAGVGLKYGEGYIENKDDRITKHCISAYNKGPAYTWQNLNSDVHGAIGNIYNSISYNDQIGIQSVWPNGFDKGDCWLPVENYLNFRNLVVYETSNQVLNLITCDYNAIDSIVPLWFESNNTFVFADNSYKWANNTSIPFQVNGDEDHNWEALPDSATMISVFAAPRQSDGSLPSTGDYFRLSANSDLIDAGIDVGLSYNGDAPDLGPFEYGFDQDSTATDIIAFSITDQSGSVTINSTSHTVTGQYTNGSGSTQTITYSLSSGATGSPLSNTSQDVSNLTITVTALDGTTTQDWTVTFTEAEVQGGDDSRNQRPRSIGTKNIGGKSVKFIENQ